MLPGYLQSVRDCRESGDLIQKRGSPKNGTFNDRYSGDGKAKYTRLNAKKFRCGNCVGRWLRGVRIQTRRGKKREWLALPPIAVSRNPKLYSNGFLTKELDLEATALVVPISLSPRMFDAYIEDEARKAMFPAFLTVRWSVSLQMSPLFSYFGNQSERANGTKGNCTPDSFLYLTRPRLQRAPNLTQQGLSGNITTTFNSRLDKHYPFGNQVGRFLSYPERNAAIYSSSENSQSLGPDHPELDDELSKSESSSEFNASSCDSKQCSKRSENMSSSSSSNSLSDAVSSL